MDIAFSSNACDQQMQQGDKDSWNFQKSNQQME